MDEEVKDVNFVIDTIFRNIYKGDRGNTVWYKISTTNGVSYAVWESEDVNRIDVAGDPQAPQILKGATISGKCTVDGKGRNKLEGVQVQATGHDFDESGGIRETHQDGQARGNARTNLTKLVCESTVMDEETRRDLTHRLIAAFEDIAGI